MELDLHFRPVMNADLSNYDLTMSQTHWDAVQRLEGLLPKEIDVESHTSVLDIARDLLTHVTLPGCPALKAIEIIQYCAHHHDLDQTLEILKHLRKEGRSRATAAASTLELYRRVAVGGTF